jgi:signal transduction histidine kinase
VSTQQSLTQAAKAVAGEPIAIALALWCWLVGVVVCAALTLATGAERAALGEATALAAAPALGGFLLLRHLGSRRVDLGFLVLWLVSAAGLVAGTGGAGSPLTAMLALAPAYASALGRAWAPEAGAAAVLAFAGASGAALLVETPALSPFPEMLAVVSLALTAALIALAPARRREGAHADARIAEVSHELRTPLTHILGFAEMIERRIFGDLGERYVEYAGLIRKSGVHLLSLVNDLLDISRIEAGRYETERECFDVRAIMEEVVRVSADSAEKRQITLGLVTPDAPLMVEADTRDLRRMLINTLANALKFTPEGGRVFLQASMLDGAIALDTVDNGPGIPESERVRLGGAYERGASGANVEGTGLGLSLVRALAGLYGGALSFHDAPGGGALVRVTLPMAR